MKDERLYLIHIAECIEKIEQYTIDGKSKFFTDSKTQDAVIRNFEIIGEAVKRLSENIRQLAPHISWRQFAGFRDILIHQYDGVDISEVWLTIENDLSKLKETIKELLDFYDKNESERNKAGQSVLGENIVHHKKAD